MTSENLKLDFVILGIQKSGSTFLHRCIRAHPQVFMPKHETPTFLTDHYEQKLKSLYAALAPASDCLVKGIKRPDYLVEEGCAERIFQHFPNCKLIAVLRNPIERAFSAYLHLMSIGFIPILEPEIGFRKLLDGTLQGAYPISETILSYGMYCNGVSTYRTYFGPDKLLLFLHEDIQNNVRGVLHTAYSFIDVDPEYVPKHEIQQRPRTSINSLLRQRVVRFGSNQMHDFSQDGLSYSKKHNPTLLNRLSYKMASNLDKRILKHICSNRQHQLTPVTVKALYAYYEDQIKELEELIGRDLSEWREA